MGYPTTYEAAPKRPSAGPTPGARNLMEAVLAKYPAVTNLGIYNPRDVCGNLWPHWKCAGSQHAGGSACDFGITAKERAMGDTLADTLVNEAAVLGVTEVIWWTRRWTARTWRRAWIGGGWQPYKGKSPHKDHIHVTLHPDAAARLTDAEAVAALNPPAPKEPAVKVRPQFDPPHVLEPIAAAVKDPGGGFYLVAVSGAVYNYCGAPPILGANGQTWFAGRTAAKAESTGPGRIRIVANTGETYNLPIIP